VPDVVFLPSAVYGGGGIEKQSWRRWGGRTVHVVIFSRSRRRHRRGEVGVDRERHVAERDQPKQDLARKDHTTLLTLGDAEGWGGNELLPTKCHVGEEEEDEDDVKSDPQFAGEEIKFSLVDVTNHDLWHIRVRGPE